MTVAITCPGCDREAELTGTLGTWIDESGHFRATYILCPECTSIVQKGSETERTQLVERIEFILEFPYQGGNG